MTSIASGTEGSPMSTPSQTNESKVKLSLLQLLFGHLPLGLAAVTMNATLLAYILSYAQPPEAPAIWLAAILLVTTARAASCIVFRRREITTADYSYWRTIFAAGALITAALWGIAGVWLFPSHSYQHQAFIGFVLAGMAAGASGSMAAHDKIFRFYLLFSIGPYTMRLVMQGEPINLAMAAMCMAFIVAFGLAGRRNTRATHDALSLRFVNDDLTQDLEKTIARYQQSNIALQEEIAKHQRTMESLEQAAHDAAESVRAKSQFLANMSHEIRTPMNGVFGMTDLLMRTGLDARQKKLVGTINESAKSLLTIINDILDLSRIEAGKLDLDIHEFNLRDLMERSVDLFASQSHKKGLEISLYIDPAVPVYAKGDSGRIKQIVLNLIGNALKFTKYGEISVRVTRLEDTGNASRIKIEIADTGIGIDRAVLEKLFQPFTQAETSISRRFGGTGLGLAIARHLTDMMGGTIALESELGKGTKAIVEVQLEHGTMTQPAADNDHSVLGGARIIVIDDRETNREIVANYLEGCAVEVSLAASTAAAWPMLVAASLVGKPYHAAIVDMVMPDENGLEFARRIKAHPTLSRLKIIIATSLNWHGDIAAIRDAGIEAVLTKPVRRSDLVDAAARSVSGTRHAGWKPEAAATKSAKAGSDEAPRRKSLSANILLAEDNPVNVEVAKEYLSGFGCTVAVVNNGLEAIATLKTATFDAILMDCQMPVMDGLTATRRIRDMEKQRGSSAVPVIALTANAFSEDRQRCLDAGMDDYLSKPYSEDQLFAVIDKWCKSPAAGAATSKPEAALNATPDDVPGSGDVLDEGVLSPIRTNRPDLLARIIKSYLTHAPGMLAELTAAASENDCERMGRAAHSLKSSSANLGATALAARCRALEQTASKNDIPQSCAQTLAITAGFAAVERALVAELEALDSASSVTSLSQVIN